MEQIRLGIEVLTGMELDPQDVVRGLDAPTWHVASVAEALADEDVEPENGLNES